MYKFLSALVSGFVRLIFRIKVVNPENMPESGACIACFNHLSFWDPVVIGVGIKRRIRFLAKAELFKVPLLGWFLKTIGTVPLKRGSGDLGAMRASLNILKNDEALGIFPTGTREKKHKNAPARSGVAFIAVKSAAPAVPVYINANYRIFSKVELIIGKPIDFSQYKGAKVSSEKLDELAAEIYDSVLELRGSK